MIYTLLTDLVIVIHFAFIVFVIFGGLFALKWRKLIWVHIPAAMWGTIVEYFNIICPLTPLENYFREISGKTNYNTGFIDRYISSVIYPEGLDRSLQFLFASIVIAINAAVYFIYFKRNRILRKVH